MIEILITAIGASLITVLGNIVLWKLQRKASKEDKADQKIMERIKAQEDEQAVIKRGLEALLHDRLYEACQHHLRTRKISATELKNIEYLYTSYHDLGGNGTGTKLYEKVQELDLIEEAEDA